MQRMGKVFAGLLVAMTMALPAFGMNINPAGQGDALVYPLYVALDGGWATKITVINTSESFNTVAKLVVRSWKNSEELLDFLIFLSPADVWTGTLQYDPALGAVVMTSTDDSVLVEVGTFASPSQPMVRPLAGTADPKDNGFLGYVYVVNVATDPTLRAPSQGALTTKPAIYSWYYQILLLDGNVAKNGSPLPPAVYPRNILAGYADIAWVGSGTDFALKPVALFNYQNKTWMDAGFETYLAATNETSMGLIRLEDLLAKAKVRLPYYNNNAKGHTFHFFTFPTKVTGQTTKQGFWWDIGTDWASTADDKPRACAKADAKIFDTTEKFIVFSPSPVPEMCSEIYWIEALPDNVPFAEGWIRYAFDVYPVTAFYDRQAGRGPGNPIARNLYAPVIPFVVNVGPEGLFSLQSAWDGGQFNRYSFYDFKPGIDVPSLADTPDPAWSNWFTDPGIETSPY